MSSKPTQSGVSSVSDQVTKGIAAASVLLLAAGVLSPLDFAIVAGLGVLWMARTRTLRV
ncbi:MAG: hypothetical protein NTY90_00650 [Candidatus Micrarchaeota archaeon]|nr:hypothetical protein [Candidatus Micrarchaeota archaeon]